MSPKCERTSKGALAPFNRVPAFARFSPSLNTAPQHLGYRHLAHLANCYAKFRHEPEVTAWLAVNEQGKFFVPYIWAVFAGGRARITSSWNAVLELKEGWRYSAHQRFPRSQLPHAYRWLRLMSARYNPAELRPIARRAILAGKRNEKMEALCGEEWGLIAKIFARQR